jgi:hypothetical protein
MVILMLTKKYIGDFDSITALVQAYNLLDGPNGTKFASLNFNLLIQILVSMLSI